MRKSLLLLSLSFGAFVFSPLANAADVSGVITLQGTPPAEREITPIKDDPNCSAMYPGALPTTHFYEVNKDGDLGDVTVYLEDASGKAITGKSTGASAPSVVLDQKGCLYHPQILAIQTGQTLLVRTSDPCVHNVHDVPTNNPESNQVQMPGSKDLTFNFKNPEMFLKFKCDVHPWMFAWVSVFDSPYFAVSAADGKFTIKDVPPGKYTLVAEHRKLGRQTAEIEVGPDGAAHNFTFAVK
jgi:plastocyanin